MNGPAFNYDGQVGRPLPPDCLPPSCYCHRAHLLPEPRAHIAATATPRRPVSHPAEAGAQSETASPSSPALLCNSDLSCFRDYLLLEPLALASALLPPPPLRLLSTATSLPYLTVPQPAAALFSTHSSTPALLRRRANLSPRADSAPTPQERILLVEPSPKVASDSPFAS